MTANALCRAIFALAPLFAMAALPVSLSGELSPPTKFSATPAPASRSSAAAAQPTTEIPLAHKIVSAPKEKVASINLDGTLKNWGFAREKTADANTATWRLNAITLTFQKDKSFMKAGAVRVWLGAPIAEKNGVWIMRRADYANTLLPFLAPKASTVALPRRVQHVLIDPGHGGNDSGSDNKDFNLIEKKLTLDVATRVKSILETKYKLRTSLTRTKDVAVSLADRALMARKINADVFVSIHFDAVTGAEADGVETFVLTPQGDFSTNDPKRVPTKALQTREIGHSTNTWNLLLAYSIQAKLLPGLAATDRGLRRARFAVLKTTTCPAVLVECGFITTPSEAKKIALPAHRQKIAESIAAGIVAYQKMIDAQLATPDPATATPPPRTATGKSSGQFSF